MRLCNSPDELDRLIRQNMPARLIRDDFSASQWLAKPANFALVEGEDLGMFEACPEWPGPLMAHIVFASRGRKALSTAVDMLAQAFAFGATEILGEIEAGNKPVRWFIRQLGFEPCGETQGRLGTMLRVRLNANPKSLALVA